MFMDISSEMIQSLLPVFLVTGFGVSPAVLGLIEGIAEATAAITKVFSGWLNDRLGWRKLQTVIGYGFALVTEPIFPFAATASEVLAARFLDRIGKGGARCPARCPGGRRDAREPARRRLWAAKIAEHRWRDRGSCCRHCTVGRV